MLISKKAVAEYVEKKFGSRLKEFRELGKGTHGTGFLVVLADGRRMVLKTLREGPLGHEYPSDRAQVLLFANHSYGALPNHIKSFDAGAVKNGKLFSIGDPDDFFLVMQEVNGEEYRKDVDRILKTGRLEKSDEKRAQILAAYLAKIHSVKKQHPSLYKRFIREAVWHNELMMGVVDIYPEKLGFTDFDELTELIKKVTDLWHRLKDKKHRLSQIHGDFYYGNIFFDEKNHVQVTDRSRGMYGEPADDVVCVIANYVFYALRQKGFFEGPFRQLAQTFLDAYLQKTKDFEILETIPLFFTSRSVIIACPIFYPDVPDSVRRTFLDVAWKVSDMEKFDLNAL